MTGIYSRVDKFLKTDYCHRKAIFKLYSTDREISSEVTLTSSLKQGG